MSTNGVQYKNTPDILYNILSEYKGANLKDIDNHLGQVCNILSINTSELIKYFSYSDKELRDDQSLNGFFAELRSVLYLNKIGFNNIQRVQKLRKKLHQILRLIIRTVSLLLRFIANKQIVSFFVLINFLQVKY